MLFCVQNLSGITYYLSRSEAGRVVIKLESHRRVRVGDDLKQTTVIKMFIFGDGVTTLTLPPILCMAMMAVWSESKLMKPYPAGSPVNLLVITLMLTTPVSPIMVTEFYEKGSLLQGLILNLNILHVF